MWRSIACSGCLLAAAAVADPVSLSSPRFRVGGVLFADDFSGTLDQWAPELDNCFWMASDARSHGGIFNVKRSGKFADYNQLLTYYVGQGGNSNTTTRFRRYIGSADVRPLRPEDDLKDPQFLLQPNARHFRSKNDHQLVAFGNRLQYYRDGHLTFDVTDAEPYTRGHFAFRTADSVYRLTSKD